MTDTLTIVLYVALTVAGITFAALIAALVFESRK